MKLTDRNRNNRARKINYDMRVRAGIISDDGNDWPNRSLSAYVRGVTKGRPKFGFINPRPRGVFFPHPLPPPRMCVYGIRKERPTDRNCSAAKPAVISRVRRSDRPRATRRHDGAWEWVEQAGRGERTTTRWWSWARADEGPDHKRHF